LNTNPCTNHPAPKALRCAVTLHSTHRVRPHSFSPLLAFPENQTKNPSKGAALAETNVKHDLPMAVFEIEK